MNEHRAREERRERDMERIRRLCLMDDVFFNVCMDGYIEGMACILRVILEMPDLIVERVTTQKTAGSLRGRGVRFDAFARAGKRLMNIEVQRDDRGAAPERARFNSSMMDARELQKGEEVTELPETYVIFITEKDVLGEGLPICHIHRVIEETGKPFGDRSHIVYVNGEVRDATPLGRLMHDFFCQDAEDMHYEELKKRASFFKEEEGGRGKMCKIMDEIWQEGMAQGMERGMAQGMERGMAQGMERGMAQGMERNRLESLRTIMRKMRLSAEDAMEMLDVPQDRWQKYKTLLEQ